VDIKGINVLITSRERTFVDMLDRPNLCGGIEEVWRSLKMIEYLNTENLLKYLKALGNSTTNAKVGFFLQRHPKITNNDQTLLRELKRMIPASLHYFDRSRVDRARLVKEWNLAIPEYILNERWEEQ
jgi:predicted transcriptional regulator of viral defense system